MTAPRKEAGLSGRPLPADLSSINTSLLATPKSGKGSSPNKKSDISAAKSKSAKVCSDKVSKTPGNSKTPFRYRWAKKLTPSNGEKSGREKKGANALQESKDPKAKAGANEKSTKKAKISDRCASPKKFEKLIDFNATAGAPAKKSKAPPTTPRKFLFGTKPTHPKDNDIQMNDAGDSDDEQYNSDTYESYDDEEDDDAVEHTPRNGTQDGWTPPVDEKGQLIGPDHPMVPQSANNMEKARKKTKSESEDPNGRKHGRKLVHWHRVRMMEKLLLILQYECHRDNIVIPWDRIVHRLQPGSSGPSATQHLNKMRDILVLEGHMVPPPLGKPNIAQDITIRGFIRDMTSDIPTATRIVGWTDNIEHRKEGLEVEGIVRGSGNYARGEDGRRSTAGPARNKPRPKAQLPAEYIQGVEKAKMSVAKDSQKKRRERARNSQKARNSDRARNTKRVADAEELGDIPDPADLPSDDDWSPKVTKKARTRQRRSTRKSAAKPERRSQGQPSSMMEFSGQDGATSNESSLPVKLVISPENLAKFPGGPSGTPASESLNQTIEQNKNDVTDDDSTDSDVDDDEVDEGYEEEEYQESDVFEEAGAEEHVDNEAQNKLSPNRQFMNNYGERPNLSYLGPEEHGTFQEWCAAVHTGIDPRINGSNYNSYGFGDANVESDDLPRGDFHALTHPAHRFAVAQVQFANANGFGAAMQHPIQTQLGSRNLNLHDDPFVDHSVQTPPHAAQPWDMAQQLSGNDTPPYHSFNSQTPDPQTSVHMLPSHDYDPLPHDVHSEHLNGYTEMNGRYLYGNQVPNNSLATSSEDSHYSHNVSRTYGDLAEHSRRMGYGEGWNVENTSHMDGYVDSPDRYQEHHFDEREENDHPNGLPSPEYVGSDDQAPQSHH